MVEEGSGPPKRVVKKVVKRTVSPPTPPTAPTPERPLRAARLATRARPADRRPSPPVAAPRRPDPTARPTPSPASVATTTRTVEPPADLTAASAAPKRSFKPTMPTLRKPTLHKPHLPTPDIRGGIDSARDGARRAVHAVVDAIAGVFHAILGAIADAWHWLIGLRLPHLSPVRGAAVTGLIVGLMSVGLGRAFYALFTVTLGTTAGGRWGFLAVVFIAFVAFIVGELLLSGFGVPHGRSISILSLFLVLLAILVFFLDLSSGIWAALIVPILAVLAYVISAGVITIAAAEKNDQRLPWEPMTEEHVDVD